MQVSRIRSLFDPHTFVFDFSQLISGLISCVSAGRHILIKVQNKDSKLWFRFLFMLPLHLNGAWRMQLKFWSGRLVRQAASDCVKSSYADSTTMTRSPIFTFSRFECCLPTYKFKDSHSDHKKPTKLHHVKPIASPQRAPVPKLLSQPEQTEATVQDTQQSPYAGSYTAPSPAAGKREFHAKQSSKKIMYSGENKTNKQAELRLRCFPKWLQEVSVLPCI